MPSYGWAPAVSGRPGLYANVAVATGAAAAAQSAIPVSCRELRLGIYYNMILPTRPSPWAWSGERTKRSRSCRPTSLAVRRR